jgi:hypothetical protein
MRTRFLPPGKLYVLHFVNVIFPACHLVLIVVNSTLSELDKNLFSIVAITLYYLQETQFYHTPLNDYIFQTHVERLFTNRFACSIDKNDHKTSTLL